MLERHQQYRTRLAFALAWGCATMGQAYAEEPVQKFIAKLKEDRLYDVALRYLELEENKGRLPASILADLPLERILLLQAALSTPQKAAELQAKQDEIEKTIRDFIASSGGHPRIAEVQLKLGDVLRSRADAAVVSSRQPENAADANALRDKAREYLAEADGLYTKIIAELTPVLQNLAGNRAKTPEDIARRDAAQDNYRQSEILQAKTLELMADTYEVSSEDWKQLLSKAEVKLTDIINKTNSASQAGRRVISQLYRGQIQAKLDKKREARESFTRVADIQEGGVFTIWRNEAIAGLIQLDLAENPPKYEAAVLRGDDAVKLLKGSERIETSAVALQLALAKARVEFSKTLTGSKNNNLQRSNQREARALLQQLMRINGPHRENAMKLLTELGGSESILSKAEELPEAKNFEEAYTQAQSRIERSETAEQTLPILAQQQSDVAELDKVKADIRKDREQAVQLLVRSISLYQESDGRESLLRSKYYLAYCYYKLDMYWEAYAVAAAVVEADRNTEFGGKAAEFALISLSKMIDATGKEEQVHLIPSLERLAKLLLEIAPGTEGARNAIDVLVTLSVRDKRYEDAERYIAMSDGNSASGASFLGQMLWRDYQTRLFEHRKNQTTETPEDKELQQKALTLLETAWGNQTPGRNDSIALYSTTTLTAIYLATDQVENAIKTLQDPAKGALAIISGNPAFEPKEKIEVYRLQLQSMLQQAAAPNAAPLNSQDVDSLINKMKETAAGDQTLLSNSLKNVIVAVHSKASDTKDPQLIARSASALGVMVSQLAETTTDIAVLDSAAAMVYGQASLLMKSPALASQGAALMKVATLLYEKIASRPAEELAAAKRKPEDIQMSMALAKAGAGEYAEAHRVFTEALTKAPMNVTFQLAAARNLQDWAAEKDIALLQKAWAGAEPTPAGGNAIWGWNKIAQLTATRVKEPAFRDLYFDARFNLAKCRMLIGLAQSDPQARRNELNQSSRILMQTRGVHPDFGSPDFKAKFEQLEQQVKAELAK